MAPTKPLLIVDGDALAHRAYYALGSVTAPDGRPIGLLQGTIAMLAGAWDAFAPRAIAFAVDSREESERHALVPAYQAQRVGEVDDDLIDQLDALPALVRAFGIPAICVPPWEADDVCATLATLEEAAGGTALVLTHDRDAYQLASARTTIIRPVSGVSEVEHVDPDGVVERYGVRPDQVPDLISLRGDPSDNIPGARGIGAKTAAELLQFIKAYATVFHDAVAQLSTDGGVVSLEAIRAVLSNEATVREQEAMKEQEAEQQAAARTAAMADIRNSSWVVRAAGAFGMMDES